MGEVIKTYDVRFMQTFNLRPDERRRDAMPSRVSVELPQRVR